MSGFETETLTQEDNLQGPAQMNSHWVEGAMAQSPRQRLVPDIDSSESPVHANR